MRKWDFNDVLFRRQLNVEMSKERMRLLNEGVTVLKNLFFYFGTLALSFRLSKVVLLSHFDFLPTVNKLSFLIRLIEFKMSIDCNKEIS